MYDTKMAECKRKRMETTRLTANDIELKIEWVPKSLLMKTFLVSGRWFSFHFNISSQQFAAALLSVEETVLHNEHRGNEQ